MKMATLGQVFIEVTPTADNPEILQVDIGAENRKDVVSMKTNKDETVDQFCTRIRSMLRSIGNMEPRTTPAEPMTVKENKAIAWEDQKAAMKGYQ